MATTNYSISWDPYQKNIADGLSNLQQNEEFVDMTIAADGYYVKVHQLMMVLASPYLKQLITDAPCKHPVLFLNDVSMQTLSLLLEYIYTGETVVPSENLKDFSKLGRSLHIKGLQDLTCSKKVAETGNKITSIKKVVETPAKTKIYSQVNNALIGGRNIALCSEDNPIEQVSVPQATNVKASNMGEAITQVAASSSAFTMTNPPIIDTNKQTKYEAMEAESDDNYDSYSSDVFTHSPLNAKTPTLLPSENDKTQLQFTTSIRGNLQIILNRYIYNFYSLNSRTGERRWRCINYRENKCLAFVITKGNVVIRRANMHNHPFHDSKISHKMLKNAVFLTIADAERFASTEESTNDPKYTASDKKIFGL